MSDSFSGSTGTQGNCIPAGTTATATSINVTGNLVGTTSPTGLTMSVRFTVDGMEAAAFSTDHGNSFVSSISFEPLTVSGSTQTMNIFWVTLNPEYAGKTVVITTYDSKGSASASTCSLSA